MTYDTVIIGGGPGGYEAALQVARLGGKAALVEKGPLGGVCTNRGCIPTKALAAACEVTDSIVRSREFGISVPGYTVDPEAVIKRRDRVSMTMRKGVEKLLSGAKVDVISGQGRLVSETEVAVNGETLDGRTLVLATGSEPTSLPGLEIDHEYVVSGDDAASMPRIPEDVVIVGGGFIGCEYASIYSRIGSRVTLIEALDRILPGEDEDVSAELHASISKTATVMTSTKVESADREGKTVKADGKDIPADTVLLAVGRRPALPEGIDDIGVIYDKTGVQVDRMMRTSVDNIYAVGDLTSGMRLAHVAYAGAEAAAHNIMGREREADFSVVPWCVFTTPEIGRVGVSEKGASVDVRVGRADYLGNGKARCMGERGGFFKVVVDAQKGTVLGAHIVGAHASDLIGEAALAVKAGMTARQVADTIHPHPTLSELFRQACLDASG
jgi:dihydrolipoamide dehydrogenase